MFFLAGFIDLNDGRAGLLIPLLSSPGNNLPYVQELDEFMKIVAVLPFLDAEMYPTITFNGRHTITVGEQGVVAFRNPSSEIVVGTIGSAFEYVKGIRGAEVPDAMFNLEMLRLVGSELQELDPIIERVAAQLFSDQERRAAWIISERTTHNSSQQIWNDLANEVQRTGVSPLRQTSGLSERS